MMYEDKQAFREYCQAKGIHHTKAAVELADFEGNQSMGQMLADVLQLAPTLAGPPPQPKTIGGPTDSGMSENRAKNTQQMIGFEAEKAKRTGTIAARVEYAKLKRKNQ